MEVFEFIRGAAVNVLVLMAFVTLCSMARVWSARSRRALQPWHMGLLYGVMAVTAMLFTVRTQGMIFDSRSGVMGAAALLGGPVTALAALPLPLLYRLYVGPPGLVPGLLEIILPAAAGAACFAWFRRRGLSLNLRRILAASALVALVTDGVIVLVVSLWIPGARLAIGDVGIALVVLTTFVSMSLLAALIRIEQAHYEAVARMADAEQRLRHSQKMAAVGELSGRVAHNFVNALTAILGNAQLARDEAGNPSLVRKSADQIVETVGRAARLASELLAFARPASPRTQRMDPARCAAGIREILARTLGAGVELSLRAEPAGKVDMDPDQIEQAVVHLAMNAAEAMPDGGRLGITVRPVSPTDAETQRLQAAREPHERHKGPFALIAVEDNGVGMTEEVSAHIFEPFFTTKKDAGNSGLGLSTVYRIVEAHRGLIDVRTAPGRGTTFLVYLPVVEPPQAPQAPA